ncbi:MAG: LLM class F420-dependent oxidoreductase [Candidatus Binatia bacterium]|nr:LLM class F420-dependent oxidoreductase [Candidatus Binatia bacterium]
MHIGLFIDSTAPFSTAEHLAATARAAEERGFHSLWVAEHVLFFDELGSKPPFAERSSLIAGEWGLLDPFAALSYLSCATEKIRLGTGVALVPQRNPVQTAKLAATIDYLSGGRLDLGLGIGWVREEFEAVDAPFKDRAARTNSYLEVMRALWEDDPSSCETPHYTLPTSRCWPKPIQTPLPVHIGGNSDGALRRAARFGNGWYGFNLEPDELRKRLDALDAQLQSVGRSRDELCISVCGYRHPVDRDRMLQYRDAGADQLILFAMDVRGETREQRLDEYAEMFLAPA